MTSSAVTPKRPRWPLILALTVPPIIIGALLTTALAGPRSSETDLWVGATDYGPTSKAPAGAVQIIHAALHDIGAQCLKTPPDLRAIASDVDLIIAFSQRYPVGRFPIDDETATASSLLIVTRQAIKDCAPENAARVNAQLARLE
jgi:hypothetical protein